MIYIRFFHAHPVATVLNEGKSELDREKKKKKAGSELQTQCSK